MKRSFAASPIVWAGSIVVFLVGAGVTLGAKPKAATPVFEGWTNDVQQATAASQANGKPILMFFTGSDWCGYCKRLKAEVFETKEFQDWAKENVVLMEVDFPRTTPQPELLKQQNAALRTKFRDITGFPAVRFVNSTGEVLGSMSGYTPGTGAEKWLASATSKLTGKPEEEGDTPKAEAGIETSYPLLTSYTEGLAAAQKDGRPLLLVISKNANPEKLQSNLTKFLTDAQLAQFAEQKVVVAHVKEPLAAGSEDESALAELRKENRLPTTPIQLLLIDATSKKVLFKSVVLPNPKALVLQLQKKLPAVGKSAS